MELLQSLEESLLDPAVRRNAELLGALLAEEFIEFGSSGRIFTRSQILTLLASETQAALKLSDFAVTWQTADAAHVTYRIANPGTGSLRSSLWIRRDLRWQMLFHQGTRSA